MKNTLEIVKLANTGILLWNTVGPLVQQALESGEDVTLEDVDAAQAQSQSALDALKAGIDRARAAGR